MIVEEIPKNAAERIRISIEEYHGHRFIDVRVYFEDSEGTWRPTKKGVALSGELAEEVTQAILKARDMMEAGS